jgi:hypothetical protein
MEVIICFFEGADEEETRAEGEGEGEGEDEGEDREEGADEEEADEEEREQEERIYSVEQEFDFKTFVARYVEELVHKIFKPSRTLK